MGSCGSKSAAGGVETPKSTTTSKAAVTSSKSKELPIVPVVPNPAPVESLYTFGKELGSGAYSRVFLCKNKV